MGLGNLVRGAVVSRAMIERYWLVHPNGGRQLIDPRQFDLSKIAEQARLLGGKLVVERVPRVPPTQPEALLLPAGAAPAMPSAFEPPVKALGPLFRARLDQFFVCQTEYTIDVNPRPTTRVLGGYYKRRKLVRVYSHDRVRGRRPLEDLFDTFLHEMAHHFEYTEPETFNAKECERVRGRMHSALFWRILSELKWRWANHQRRFS